MIRTAGLLVATSLLFAPQVHADTLAVDPVFGPHTTITSALTAAQSGDLVAVQPGSYNECDLFVPVGVHLLGAGVSTELQASLCSNNPVLTLASGASAQDVLVTPPDDFTVGVLLEGDADLLRVHVRGGIQGIRGDAPGDVVLESVLVVTSPAAQAGIHFAGGTAELTRVTLAGFGATTGIDAGSTSLDVTDSILEGWATGIDATAT